MDGETDDELVARVAQGDRRAFGVLVERRSGQLMALAYRITADRAAAEDVVQETFVRAWTKAPAWAADPRRAAYATWLGRVAVNLAIDHKRKVAPLPLSVVGDPPDPSPGAEAGLQADERRALVRAAVAELPQRQRAALSLTYDLGLSNVEAAKALSTSVGALELLLVRARKSLRLALADEGGRSR